MATATTGSGPTSAGPTSWTPRRSVLKRLEPALRELGVAVAIETHADATADEILALLDDFEPEVLGVTLDTGNLPMRLDDPVAAVERLAPRVLATHVKDAVLAFTPRGLCWQARPVGSGILPMPDLLAILHRANPGLMLSIELHPRTYDLPIFDPSWLAFFPDLRPESLAAVVRLAASCERRFAEGSLARPEVVEADPLGRPRPRLAGQLARLPPGGRRDARPGRGRPTTGGGCRGHCPSGMAADPDPVDPAPTQRQAPGLQEHREGLLAGPLGGGVAPEHGGDLVDPLGRRRAG